MGASVTGPIRIVSDGLTGTIAGRVGIITARWRLGRAEEQARIPVIKTREINGIRDAAPRNFAEVMQCDRDAFNRFFHAMLDAGVYLAPSAYEAGFVSSAHSAADVAATLAAAREAFKRERDSPGRGR